MLKNCIITNAFVLTIANRDGSNALWMAAYEGQTNMVLYLTGNRLSRASLTLTNGMGWSPLSYMIYTSWLSANDEINKQKSQQEWQAVVQRRLSMVSCLISRGAEPNFKKADPAGKVLMNYTNNTRSIEGAIISGWIMRRDGFTFPVASVIVEYFGDTGVDYCNATYVNEQLVKWRAKLGPDSWHMKYDVVGHTWRNHPPPEDTFERQDIRKEIANLEDLLRRIHERRVRKKRH
jgi:hypothetical protein